MGTFQPQFAAVSPSFIWLTSEPLTYFLHTQKPQLQAGSICCAAAVVIVAAAAAASAAVAGLPRPHNGNGQWVAAGKSSREE